VDECKIHTCSLGTVEENYQENSINDKSFIHEHLTTLYFIAKEFKCYNILELGTSIGESTIALHQAVRELNGCLTTIDIDQKLTGDEHMKCIESDTLNPDIRLELMLDMLFVDSLHTYKQVKAELEKYGHMVKQGGFIILHDITNPSHMEINKAIAEYFDDSWVKYRWFNNNGLQVMRKL
jgi:predicted O-methyltransferase YrrM